MSPAAKNILPALQNTIDKLTSEFDQIPDARKTVISRLVQFMNSRLRLGQNVQLTFICTHNSRRSHIAQIWAQTAAYLYGISRVETFSGGTEATAFNPRAVTAMQNAGFQIIPQTEGTNPAYEVTFSKEARPLMIFSKTYNDSYNPASDFAAVMTCSHADENCPIVPGSLVRIALTYDDPKDFDSTPEEFSKYAERVYQIGRELLYAFSITTKS